MSEKLTQSTSASIPDGEFTRLGDLELNSFLELTAPIPAGGSSSQDNNRTTDRSVREANTSATPAGPIEQSTEATDKNEENKKLRAQIQALQDLLKIEEDRNDRLEDIEYEDKLNVLAKKAAISSLEARYAGLYHHNKRLQNEVAGLKRDLSVANLKMRQEYPLLTTYHLSKLRKDFEAWKVESNRRIAMMCLDNADPKRDPNVDSKYAEDSHRWLIPQIRRHANLVVDLRKGNLILQNHIHMLRESKEDILADLEIARLEAFIEQRKEFITELQKEMDQIENDINSEDEDDGDVVLLTV
ncbi:hypothetical protein F53441_5385 [Fusarium austroafricanum]|uniref:Uncharacterized protein n=1 Tax=Fusarium austroafricanum TaxID=2364996 RepID=A0A8H4KKZ1_9HYPO|nr:hypothetical protein F53441_5385 [Fusarium austroafricanum]